MRTHLFKVNTFVFLKYSNTLSRLQNKCWVNFFPLNLYSKTLQISFKSQHRMYFNHQEYQSYNYIHKFTIWVKKVHQITEVKLCAIVFSELGMVFLYAIAFQKYFYHFLLFGCVKLTLARVTLFIITTVILTKITLSGCYLL